MKIWCDNCNGRGEISKKSITNSFYFDKCPDCKGKGYTNPPQQILDDLECAEIDRKLVKKQLVLSNSYSVKQDEFCLEIYDPSAHYGMIFKDKTKLGTYKQALVRIEGRG